MALTKEDLELLTPEERAGYEEDLDEELDEEGGEEPNDEGEEGGEPDDADEEGEEEGEEGDAADEPPADEPPADEPPADEPEDEAPDTDPLPEPTTIEGVEEKRAAFEASRDELTEKYENGEITTTEYMKDLRKIDKEEDELNWQLREAELEARRVNETVNAKWYGHVESFLGEHTDIQRSKLTMDAFDQLVREETAKTMQKGYQPGPADLQRAYTRWRADLGYEGAENPQPTPKPKAAPKKGQRPIPPSLAKVPAADMTDTDDGEFAHLDRMADSDPLGFEEALAKMPEAVRDRYLAS